MYKLTWPDTPVAPLASPRGSTVSPTHVQESDLNTPLVIAVQNSLRPRRRLYLIQALACAASGLIASPTVTAGGVRIPELGLFQLSPTYGNTGSAGFVIQGAFDGDAIEAHYVGDINGDGAPDIGVEARYAPDGTAGVGTIYVLFGRSTDFSPQIDLADLPDDAMLVSGARVLARGRADLNGDGIDDLVMGSPEADPGGRTGAGRVYVVYGRHTFPATLALNTLEIAHGGNGADGFVLNGEQGGAGTSIGIGPDVNGDTLDDLLIGEPGAGEADAGATTPADGRAYVVFGRTGGMPFPAEIELTSLSDGTGLEGFALDNEGGRAAVGTRVGLLGDVNDDDLGDLLVSGYSHDGGGTNQAYLVFGRQTPFASAEPLDPADASLAVSVFPNMDEYPSCDCEYSVSEVHGGDVNGDGINDLMFSFKNNRRAYVLFGRAQGDAFPLDVELATLRPPDGDGSRGYLFERGLAPMFVGPAGDVNEDGIGDVLIGVPNDRQPKTPVGAAYVYFGQLVQSEAVYNLGSLNDHYGYSDGTEGFTLRGIDDGDLTGQALSLLGDVNGDGTADVLVSSPGGDPHGRINAGEAFVFFGNGAKDSDADGHGDTFDNCLLVPNPTQQDSEGDQYGNACDADFDQNCTVDFTDLIFMKALFWITGDFPEDLTGDGVINFEDLAVFKTAFSLAPGPSGTGDMCDP